jgi:sporulation protein YlmC with PRC-barrel domain
MHLRFSISVGTPVVEEETGQILGSVAGILLQPDTGKIEGFFISIPGLLSSRSLFLSGMDILRWGSRIYVRDADVLSPVEEHIRLQGLLAEGRPMLGQGIVTESGKRLGSCADVQFDSARLVLEWLFPRKLLRWGTPIPVSQVIEVRKDVILVRDPVTPVQAAEPKAGIAAAVLPVIDALPEAA